MSYHPNLFTKFQAKILPQLGKNPYQGRIFWRLSPVFAYVMSHKETAYGIDPLYDRWLFVSPKFYINYIWNLSAISLFTKFFIISFGLTFGPIWTLFLHQMGNVKDVRWRATKVTELLKDSILNWSANTNPNKRILVDIIGAGSGCYAIEALLQLKQFNIDNVLFRFIDTDSGTYKLAKKYAVKKGLKIDEFEQFCPFYKADILSKEYPLEDSEKLHVILMVGLGDHLDKNPKNKKNDSLQKEDVAVTNKNIIDVYRRFYDALDSKGVFITSFISHNIEEKFLEKAIKWRHRHRNLETIKVILEKSGWNNSKQQSFKGPNKIQNVLLISK